jgi:hypothetical protein
MGKPYTSQQSSCSGLGGGKNTAVEPAWMYLWRAME